MHHLKEILGFLCRWCLLLLAGGAVIAGAWTVVLATTKASTGLNVRLAEGDAVVAAGRGCDLRAYLVGCGPRSDSAAALFGTRDGPCGFANEYGGRIYLGTAGLTPGRYACSIRGIPYGPAAFENAEPQVIAIDPGREVFMIDVRTALPALAGNVSAFAALLEALRARGEVCCFDEGGTEDFLAHQSELRARLPDMPLCWEPRPGPGTLNTLRATASRARHKPVIITEDAGLAEKAADDGFPTHLILPPGAVKPRPGLQCHVSLAELKEAMAVTKASP